MPLVKISLLDHWSDERVATLNDLVHASLVEALGIEEWDYFHRVDRYRPADFRFPAFKSQDFLILEIHLFPGRTAEQKEAIYETIAQKASVLGIAATDLFIQLFEQPDLHWGIGGRSRGSHGP